DAEPRRVLRLGDEVLDRVAAERRQVLVRLGLRPDEVRQDEVVEVEPRLPHERAQPVASPEAAQPRRGKGTHANNLRAPRRAGPPKITPSTSSHRPCSATVRHGLRSYSAERKKSTAWENGSRSLIQPAGGTISAGIRPRKTIGITTRTAISDADRASRAMAPRNAPSAPTEPPARTSPTTSSGSRRHGSPPVTPPTWITRPNASDIARPSASATAAASATFDQTSCPSPTSPRARRPTTFSSRSAASDPAASRRARKVIVSPSA